MKRTPALLCIAAVVGLFFAASAASASVDERVLAGMNAQRAAHGLPGLAPSARLNAAARQHSLEMLAKGYFRHTSFDGSAFWRRIRRFYGGQAVGENLAWAAPDLGVRGAMALWMASPEHRENILDPAWRESGVSVVHVPAAPGVFGGLAVTVITVDFGARDAG